MNSMTRRIALFAACSLIAATGTEGALTIDSLSGAVTSNEIAQFKAWARAQAPAGDASPIGTLSYGADGRRAEAMGVMYELTQDKAILDDLLRLTDKILSLRNNPSTGTFDWTGQRELIWRPEEVRSHTEEGLIAAHISYAAQLILQTPSLWNQTVSSGNAYGYGGTYKARADRYVLEMDKTEDQYMIRWYVRSDNRYYFPTDPRYDGGGGGNAVPFNQQWMMNFNKWRLAKCHEILGNSSRAARLRQILQTNLTWFAAEFDAWTAGGQPASLWYYDPVSNSQKEDLGHAQHGIIGMHHLDTVGGYSSFPDRTRMGNTIRYAVYKSATDGWSHKIDGTGTVYDSIQPGFILLSRYVSSLYTLVGNDQINAGKVASNPDVVAYILWAKQARYRNNWVNPRTGGTTPPPTSTPTTAPSSTPGPTATPTPGGGGGSWAPNTAYAAGAIVTYGGVSYRCLQAHTSQVGWEPPNAPALWARQ